MTTAAPWPPVGDRIPLHRLSSSATRAHAGPTPSIRLVSALRQLKELRSTLLRIDPIGAYTPAECTRARAFVVLAHGVIEDYLEGICLEVLDGAIKAFNVDGRSRTALLALLRYAASGEVPVSYQGGPWGLRGRLTARRRVVRQWVEANNGIKEKTVLRALPTGLKESDMASPWLSAMSDLGAMRGRGAHRGYFPEHKTPRPEGRTRPGPRGDVNAVPCGRNTGRVAR